MNPIAKEISALQNSPEDVYVVHFSHGITSNAHHYYPRIVCIYVQNINGSESKKFSIENLAKKQKVPIEEIADWYDELESFLLDEFDEFLRSKTNCIFIYWAEDNKELILDVIKSRFEELNKKENRSFCSIPNGNRKSVYFLVNKIDSSAPRDLKQFVKTYNNQALVPGFLTIEEEQSFFDKKDFGKVGTSVVAKVSFFVRIIHDFSNKRVEATNNKTKDSEAIDIRALNPIHFFKRLTLGSWLIVLSIISGLFMSGFGLKNYFSNEEIKDISREKAKAEEKLKDNIESHSNKVQTMEDTIKKLHNENSKLQLNVKEKTDSLRSFQRNDKPGKVNSKLN